MLENTIEANGKRYLVSTVKLDAPQTGWETLVFECGADGFLIGNEIVGRRWDALYKAQDGHAHVVNTFGAAQK